MKTDAELLQKFVNRRDEGAFTDLVNRHVDVVYSAARRETQGDVSAAEDVTQLVFIQLARKAAALQQHPTVAGWLYTSVRHLSANFRCADHRRKNPPLCDGAMHALDECDGDAVRLHAVHHGSF